MFTQLINVWSMPIVKTIPYMGDGMLHALHKKNHIYTCLQVYFYYNNYHLQLTYEKNIYFAYLKK